MRKPQSVLFNMLRKQATELVENTENTPLYLNFECSNTMKNHLRLEAVAWLNYEKEDYQAGIIDKSTFEKSEKICAIICDALK